MINKTEIDRIMKTEGKVKGAVFQTDAEYIKRTLGLEKLNKIRELLNSWGYPMDYENTKALEWFPAGLRALSLLAIQSVAGLDDGQIKEMGNQAPKHSFIVRLLFNFFVSLKKLSQSAPEFWRRHWAAGKLEAGEFNEAGKYLTIIIKDLDLHPFFCKYEEGYLQRIAQYINPSAKCQELKCTFRGGPHHEYRISWD
ncbi:MAG: hypothetical protein PHH60_02265 [Candidatus Margulisbacteria bacterium]|nr:hypothetical protein [Candidatus Margulisiibacteriota bacterium]